MSEGRCDSMDPVTGMTCAREFGHGGVHESLSGQSSWATPVLKVGDVWAEVERLRAALSKISEGRGPFSRDPYEHACNCIESMKQIAADALAGKQAEDE